MKTIKSVFLYTFLMGIVILSGCLEEDLADIQVRSGGRVPGDKAPNPVPALIPPSSMIRQDYPQATRWLVTWDHPFWENKNSLASIFNTTNGTFHSVNSLNADGPEATVQADIALLFGRVQSVEHYSTLTHQAHAPITRFKPSSLTYPGFRNALSSPALFQQEYEDSPLEPTRFQPYNYEAGGGDNVFYKSGEIYLFKTDHETPRYGAIRIVQGTDITTGITPRIIEIVLADTHTIVELDD